MKNVEIICNGCQQHILERNYVTVTETGLEHLDMHFHNLGCLHVWMHGWKCPTCGWTLWQRDPGPRRCFNCGPPVSSMPDADTPVSVPTSSSSTPPRDG